MVSVGEKQGLDIYSAITQCVPNLWYCRYSIKIDIDNPYRSTKLNVSECVSEGLSAVSHKMLIPNLKCESQI